MKTLYLTLFLLISYTLYSQNEIYFETSESLDSTYFYQNVSNEFQLTDKYFVLEKTEFGKTLNAIQLFYDIDQNIWINHFSDTNKYFENQALFEYIRKYWDIDNNEWLDCEYTQWDEHNNIEDTYQIYRIYGIPMATYGNRQCNTYDENTNLIQSIKKACGNDLIWSIHETKDYTYDEYNRLVTYVIDSITKWEYLYNDNDLNDEIFISLYQANQGWDTTWHHILTYSNDTLIEDLTYWFATNTKFHRDTIQYDLNENISLRYQQLWDTISQTWEMTLIEMQKKNINNLIIEHFYYNPNYGIWRYLYEYDPFSNLIEYKEQIGDSNNLIDEWRYLYSYTENNNLLEQEYHQYDENNNTWLPQNKHHNYWSIITSIPEINDIEGLFEIYPNPCSQFLFVKYNHFQPYSIKLYDLKGDLKFINYYNSKDQMLDLSHLNHGTYIISLDYNGMTEQKLFILK